MVFNKAVLGLQAADLLINGHPASTVSASSNACTFYFTQPAPGPVRVSWDESQGISDLFGNNFNSTATNANWNYTFVDLQPPTVVELTPVAGAQVSRLSQIEVTFSESVLGVNASDLLINGQPAAVSVVGSGAGPYLFQFSQPPGTVNSPGPPGMASRMRRRHSTHLLVEAGPWR